LTAAIGAQDKKDPPKKAVPKKPEVTLKVGDPAPPLKATKWLQGTEVTGFSAGKVYVVEFWATWCGPCIVMMPHMSDMQEEFKDKGVTFIGFSAKDPGNTQEKVTQFVEKRGPKLKYSFAYADDRDTYDSYMKAAGQNGIPCSYVVDQQGKIAFIGHPMFLDVVLPRVVEGKWTPDDVKSVTGIEKEIDAIFQAFGQPDTDAALKTLAEFEKKHPRLAGIPYFNGPRINLMLRAKKVDEAKATAEKILAKALKQEDPLALQTVSSVMRSPAARPHKELLTLSLQAAEAGLKVAGDKDFRALYNMADTHFVMGNRAKAKEFGQKAIAAADNDRIKQQLEEIVKKYDEEKKDEKKDDK
jgi:thiol-disulfide isomerase/thioredoxin